MEIIEFEKQLKIILRKVSEASDMNLEWVLVSGDPDCVADFGCDNEGNLVIDEATFPLNIKDMTAIRYRWNSKTDGYDNFIRFDFGKNISLDCCVGSDFDIIHVYNVRYNDAYGSLLEEDEAIDLVKKCVEIKD